MSWNHLYSTLDPIAFRIFSLPIHWYGVAYTLALITALIMAKWIAKRDSYPISGQTLESYFIWVEIGVILGARLGYIFFYDPYFSYYLTRPWEIFNPYQDGEFVGIRGMSYHGGVIGFLVASILFSSRNRVSFFRLMDLAGLAIPLGYFFGRIGNFLNQELIGRPTDLPWGIYVDSTLRHPSQIYEAFLEGVLVFLILYLWRKRAKFIGQIGLMYLILYSITRAVAEIWREPDSQLGFIIGEITMGQILSLLVIFPCLILWVFLSKRKGLY